MQYHTRYLTTTISTNIDAVAWARKGAEHGSGVIAEQQQAGRGRLGREWFSPPGKNLYCSIIVRPEIAIHDYPKLTLVSGLALAEYLESKFKIKVGLKWPNDIIIGGKKCGGILCESSIEKRTSTSFAVIGIGLNCNLKPLEIPPDLKDIATSLIIEGCQVTSFKVFFEGVRSRLLEVVEEFQDNGFPPLLRRWRKRDILHGQMMEWVNSAGEVISGTSLGPDENGVLHVIDENAVEHEVISGDIRAAFSDDR